MPTFRDINTQINSLIKDLIELGLSDDQNSPFEKSCGDGLVEITFPGAQHTSIAMKDTSYVKIYDRLKEERAYIAIMADGSMIQMMYAFRNGELERHRLAFFPSPHLEEFQNAPEIYLEDEIYADIVAKNIVPFPIRFDFDAREGVYEEVVHPKSHLTLGQYRNCRIPVSSPLMPFHFIEFILRNFYHTVHNKFSHRLRRMHTNVFDPSILQAEENIIHVQIPPSI
ncbi:MAG: DUF2290 domain-containing protein [Candidatus Scalindua sp.]|nr:DUF2290 domain-containing protein [Candidatus Scalindua sp.]